MGFTITSCVLEGVVGRPSGRVILSDLVGNLCVFSILSEVFFCVIWVPPGPLPSPFFFFCFFLNYFKEELAQIEKIPVWVVGLGGSGGAGGPSGAASEPSQPSQPAS